MFWYEGSDWGEIFMQYHKLTVVTGLVLVLSLIFIGSNALCQQSEDAQDPQGNEQQDPQKPQEPGQDKPEEPGPNEPQEPKDSQPQIIIVPAEATMAVREQLQFGVRVQTQSGENVDTTGFEFSWQVMGNIGTISPNGLFVASDNPGRGMVRVSFRDQDRQMISYALVKVAEGGTPPGPQKRIVVLVRPESAIVAPGATAEFTVEPSGTNDWRVIPPRIGSVSADQGGRVVFTASQNSGRGILVATVQTDDGTGTGRSNIIVDSDKTTFPQSKLKLIIQPKHARVEAGESTDFEVQIAGPGNDYSDAVEWEVSPGELGHIVGDGDRISFVAGSTLTGRALVTAKIITDSGVGMDWATVDVGVTGSHQTAKTRLVVVPEDASMKVGESRVFTSDIAGENGLASWSVAPKRIGTINESGLFTATEPGWGLVIAKANIGGGIGVGQARIFVGTESSTPLKITISPQDAEAFTDGSPVTFTARVTDMNDRLISGVPIQWKVVPGHIGSMDQAGTFMPGNQPGRALVTAKVENASGIGMAQARLTITNRVQSGRLIVSVTGSQSLKIGTAYTYQVSVTDSEGKPLEPAEVEISWRVIPSKLGEVIGNGTNATFTPGVAGRGVIMAEVKASQGTGTGRISVTVDK